MGNWRYYVMRPGSNLWLDTNAQLRNVQLEWSLDGPSGGVAQIPAGLSSNYVASDGQDVYGKWNTIVFAEEDGNLAWHGIVTAVDPDKDGTKLEFTGFTGWLNRVPYNTQMSMWETEVFEVIRKLIQHSATYSTIIPITVTSGTSMFKVGDPEPPARPAKPTRNRKESKKDFQNSTRYKNWETALANWKNTYGDNSKYRLGWWEAPYVGEELASLAKEFGFNYRENVQWLTTDPLVPKFTLELNDNYRVTRNDIKLVDGVNLAAQLDTAESDMPYAKQVIGLGAGEGRTMIRAVTDPIAGNNRLFQAEYAMYKTIKKTKRLKRLIEWDLKIYSDTYSDIDNVLVWDFPGFAPVSSLQPGNVVEVISNTADPKISAWRRIVDVTRDPVQSTVLIGLETQ